MSFLYKMYAFIKAMIISVWIATTLILLAIVVLVLYVISFILPGVLKRKVREFLYWSPNVWIAAFRPALYWLGARHWQIDIPDNLQADGIYLVMCNHQSWADILILYYALYKKVALLKFFMKKELLWQLPLAGLGCKAVGYPFLSRHSKSQIKKNPALKNKDKQSTQKACDFVKAHPASLMIFPEGTRLTSEKHSKQKSPFKHLLKPRAGGVVMTLNGVDEALAGMLNVSISFGCAGSLSMWKFLEGKYKQIKVNVESINISDDLKGDYATDKTYRKHIQAWLNNMWEKKDQWLGENIG